MSSWAIARKSWYGHRYDNFLAACELGKSLSDAR